MALLRSDSRGELVCLDLTLERWDVWANQMLRPVGTVEMLLPHYVDNELMRVRDLARLLVDRERCREDRARNTEALTAVVRGLLERKSNRRPKPQWTVQ